MNPRASRIVVECDDDLHSRYTFDFGKYGMNPSWHITISDDLCIFDEKTIGRDEMLEMIGDLV